MSVMVKNESIFDAVVADLYDKECSVFHTQCISAVSIDTQCVECCLEYHCCCNCLSLMTVQVVSARDWWMTLVNVNHKSRSQRLRLVLW